MWNGPPQSIWSEVAEVWAETELMDREKGFTILEWASEILAMFSCKYQEENQPPPKKK